MLIMRNERSDLVAIGPVSIEYQAAMLRDDIENSSGWTGYGIAQILTQAQARAMTGAEKPASPSGGQAPPAGQTPPAGQAPAAGETPTAG
jgi:hypothetical protein